MNRYRTMLEDIRAELATELATERAADHEAQARRFLAALDPDSTLGMWFDAIASSFPTRLDAAIA